VQLDWILASTGFADAERASGFLRFIVERRPEGRAGGIKESVIAVEVLGRNASFTDRPFILVSLPPILTMLFT
jgi:hypothetical protein